MTIKAQIKLDPRVKLKAKRTLEGNVLIVDHEDIDIVLLPEKNKCIAFPKENMSDKVYATQDRLYSFLAKKGVLSHSTVRGGNVFGSMEADIFESKLPGIDATQAFLYALHEFIKEERPYFRSSSHYDEERLDALLSPSDEDSTELGDVPQSAKKGSMHKQIGPYGFQYNYSLVRENESED
ncbi:MAG: hypothetical protein CBD16_05270 [Betaproteobacteria bacterium TMED156]|nr:MAG: hypothetical protein CBD16_05270 [Betaproteobacteria bacterium TMED156]|tara:strand:- start:535 stop:1077 length:543 start_codon:yes stop_codon:yes gene_type:complete